MVEVTALAVVEVAENLPPTTKLQLAVREGNGAEAEVLL
jgi:hypothetical protein